MAAPGTGETSVERTYILGGGVTGLAAGIASGLPVYEARTSPGGICASYYRDGFRFEVGGGHWLFGTDPVVRRLIESTTPVGEYGRRSAVFFAGGLEATRDLAGLFTPYPIQNNLWALPESVRATALAELAAPTPAAVVTMADWLRASFGPTLDRIFFAPFHEKYTAGLMHSIAPQDAYKSPVDPVAVVRGAFAEQTDAGYNTRYLYPRNGLDALMERLAGQCDLRYGQSIVGIDVGGRTVRFADGAERPYDQVVSTLPLNRMMEMTGLDEGECDPHTSVLVLNLGVTLPDTPRARNGNHWLYVPDAQAWFHRIGYYSNVDRHFVPEAYRDDPAYASLYIESAFPPGTRLSEDDIARHRDEVIAELRRLGMIDRVLVADPTWIDVAYTWRRPGSTWVRRALARLLREDIVQTGRYGAWVFQGIGDSLRSGLFVGAALRAGAR